VLLLDGSTRKLTLSHVKSFEVREATAYNNDVHTNLPASTEDLFKGLYTTPNYHLQHIDHRVAPAETKGTEGSF